MKRILFILTIIALVSCKEEPSLELSKTSIEIDWDQELTLTATLKNAPEQEVVWETDDVFIATVSEGKVKGITVGQTQIMAKSADNSLSATCDVKVNPTITIYKDPSTQWDANKSTVKASENRDLLSETEDAILYEGENSNLRGIMYSFENSKLESTLVLIANNATALDNVINHIIQRYEPLGAASGVILFRNKETAVGITYHTSMGYVALMYRHTASKSNIDALLDQFILNYKELTK